MLRRTLNLGILAHVDAGKTTLTERLLYAAGVIDEIGSVDDGSTQTDTLALERQRGITIKSAVVSFAIDDVTVNLIDTPGHPDFIAEVERVLSVLDGAVLVDLRRRGRAVADAVAHAGAAAAARPDAAVREQDGPSRRGLRARHAGDRGAADAGDRPDGIRERRRVSRPAGRGARRARRGDPRRVRRGREHPLRPASRRSSPRRRSAASSIRCSSARRSPAPGVDALMSGIAELLPAAEGRRRRPAVGERLQDRARAGGRADRVCPDVLGRAAGARPAAGRRGRAQGDRHQRLRPGLRRSARGR